MPLVGIRMSNVPDDSAGVNRAYPSPMNALYTVLRRREHVHVHDAAAQLGELQVDAGGAEHVELEGVVPVRPGRDRDGPAARYRQEGRDDEGLSRGEEDPPKTSRTRIWRRTS